MAITKREVWLTEKARASLRTIEAHIPVKAKPSQIIEAALTEYAAKVRASGK